MITQRPLSPSQIRNPKFAIGNFVLLFALCALPFASAHGQSSSATLSGTVEDENGAVIPGAAIMVLNPSTALQRQATTNDQGSFTVTLLQPGTYSVTVRRDGFAPIEIQSVVLNVGDQKSLQIALKPGNVSEMVQIEGDALLINTSPAVATTINRTFVGNLPLNGRSFSSLVLLTPGVTVTPSTLSTDPGQFSVNGQRASTNYFTVDGASANFGTETISGVVKGLFLSGALPGTSVQGGTANLVSIDALEEFKIQTSTYTAEAGRQPGGQVQIVTRSGKNEFHGLLFEYFRNEAFDAREYFNKKPAAQTPLRQNIYGGTFSGPLPFFNFGEGGPMFTSGKDRTFFFFSYEAQRLRVPSSGSVNVPSQRLRDLAAQGVRPVLDTFPLPTGEESLVDHDFNPSTPSILSGVAPYNFSWADPSSLDSTGIRIDHAINSKHTLFGRFNEAPSDSVGGIIPRFHSLRNTRTLTLGATSILSTRLTNELRFNYSRSQAKATFQDLTVGGAVPIDPAVLTSGLPGLGNVSINLPGAIGLSIQGGVPADSFQRQINITDNVSLIAGSHNFKFGADFRRLMPIYGALDSQTVNFFLFTSTLPLQTGVASSVNIITRQPSEPQFDNWSLYVQDTWKASKRLTLDLGLRWEINPAPSEKEGRMPPIVLGVVGTDVSGATLAPEGTQFYKTHWTAFAPRFGAAYQLRTKQGQETVLRGGFGVFYDLGSGSAAGGWPLSRSVTLPNAAFPNCPAPITFPIPAACAIRPGIAPLTLPTASAIITPNENLKLPYSLHWNLAVEQSLGKEQTISVSYVASAGRRLLTQIIYNRAPRDPVTGVLQPRPNTSFGDIRYSFNGPTSDYNSMQVQYRTRFRQGLQALVNYTWAHAIDEVSTDVSAGIATVFERGNANFDVRHNFSSAINYDLPRLNAGPVLTYIFRDWTLSAIIHAQSAPPVDIVGITAVVDQEGTVLALRPDYIPGMPLYIDDPSVQGGRRFNADAFRAPPLLPLGNAAARQGTFGRNVMRQLPLYQVDFALGRTFRLNESLGLQLKAEAFNAFNHPMFSNFGLTYTNRNTFGVPTTTLNRSLGGLSSIYQIGGPRSIQLSARLSF